MMKANKDPQAAIYIEEEHHYSVDLGVVQSITWQPGQARGSIRIEIPYDGAVLKKDASTADQYEIGTVKFSFPQMADPTELPIRLEAGSQWETNIKSSRKCLIEAQYPIEQEPGDSLISVDGLVLDDVAQNTAEATADGIFSSEISFRNPLMLKLSLWVPDLLADTRPSDLYELETILLRGENTRQIFMSSPLTMGFEKQLAENMAALANTAGGIILLGVSRGGDVVGVEDSPAARQHVAAATLRAALHSKPVVPIWQLGDITHPDGLVIRIEIPAAGSAVHQINGTVYQRQGRQNIATTGQDVTAATTAMIATTPESSLGDIFDRDETGGITFRSRDDVIVRNGGEGLSELRIGAYLCGLINAGKQNGRIIITDLPTDQNKRFAGWFNFRQDLESIVRDETSKMLPQINMPHIERRHLGNQQVAIIHMPAVQFPISLYDGTGYLWQNLSLNEIKGQELFDKYLELTGSRGNVYDDQDVNLERALLNRPIRPPERVDTENQAGSEIPEYDLEYQAQVWQPRAFRRNEDTLGFPLELTVPLSHISLTLADNGEVVTKEPEATGTIRVRLNDVLVSGCEVTPEANEENHWLNAIPVIKRTYLQISYKARLNELFHRRKKTSQLRFLLPDVLLDRERVEDLAQVCADVGFRVTQQQLFDAGSSTVKATINGIRSHRYHDIALLIGLNCERTELTRELHYDGWRDSKSTYTTMLDIRVKLSGTGEEVQTEIGRLQMDLYRTISQRLQHLRAE
jgi:hypothetical protein